MKKKVFSLVTAAVLAVTMTAAGAMPVFAKAQASPPAVTPDTVKAQDQEYAEGEALVLFTKSFSMSKKSVMGELDDGGGMTVEKVWNFEDAGEITDQWAEDQGGMKTFASAGTTSGGGFLNIALIRSSTLSTEQLIKKLSRMKGVKYAEPNYRIHALTNDEYFGKQWYHDNTGQDNGTPGISTHAGSMWDKGFTGSEDVIAAVVDTGIDYKHPDLKDNLWTNTHRPDLKGKHGFDFINGDEDPMDDNGHGTHCAGIIGAQGDNGTGISGVNQNVSLMALKILDEDGSSFASFEVDAYMYINRALNLGEPIRAINNSWGGGGSDIFGELVELVGSKGAVTVLAAGNEGTNEDEDGVEYPQDPECDSMISVAAVNNQGSLADFSNYGKDTVDVAAPGAGILSTVSYDNYMPTLYDAEKQQALSKCYEDFDGGAIGDLITDPAALNVVKPDGATVNVSVTDERSTGEGGSSLRMEVKGLKPEQAAAVEIPFSLDEGYYDEDNRNIAYISAMQRCEAADPEGFSILADVPADYEFNTEDLEDLMWNYMLGGSYFDSKGIWGSVVLPCNGEKNDSTERKILVICFAGDKSDHVVYLDDIGISKADADVSSFGKYDYMSGTSMAAPVVTGAVALIAQKHPDYDAHQLINEVLGHVSATGELEDKVIEGGMLDFSSNGGDWKAGKPKIASVKVDPKEDKLIISGRNLGDARKVEIGDSESPDGMTETDIRANDRTSVEVDAGGFINTIADIRVTTPEGEALKEYVYLVKGKTEYSDAKIEGVENWSGAAADNKNVYVTDADEGTLYRAEASTKALEFDMIEKLDVKKLFGEKLYDESNKDAYVEFLSSPVTIDGKVYAIVSASLGTDEASNDDGWFFFSTMDAMGGKTSYAQKYGLVCMDPSLLDSFDEDDSMYTGDDLDEDEDEDDLGMTISSLIDTGAWFDKYEDVTLASYAGKLYLIGGYDYVNDRTSTRVMVYDPATKKWSDGPELPEGRAGGIALQTDSGLVYTMGYAAPDTETGEDGALLSNDCPKNLILKGSTWTQSQAEIAPYIAGDILERGDDQYTAYTASVGITRGGLVYTGVPCEGLGDTFTYDVASDRYDPMEFNYITNLYGGETFGCVAVGDKLWGLTETGEAKTIPIKSGKVSVKATGLKNGKITGAGTAVVPGSKVTLKPKANKGWYLKKGSFKLNGKAAGTSKTIRVNNNSQTVTATFLKAVDKIKLSKKSATLKVGKTLKLKATVLPKKAANKKVTWKSSNRKYATVTSKGVVKALKKGKGKTVKITCTAKDGSGKKAVCKIKIK